MDVKLYSIVARELNHAGYIHPKLLVYIVDKNCESTNHDFTQDEQFALIKRKCENQKQEYDKMILKRQAFYRNSFAGLEKFRKSSGYMYFTSFIFQNSCKTSVFHIREPNT